MPSPLGPYRSPPREAALALRAPAVPWIAALGIAVTLLAIAAWLAPGVTAAIVGALALYGVAPWFITRAPGG